MQYTTNRNLLPLERVNPKKSRAFFVSSIAQKKKTMLEILDYPSVLHDIAIARLSTTSLRVVICHRKGDNNKVINL